MAIVIDDEFRRLIPPLSAEELALLEQNLLAAGRATDPLKTWRHGPLGQLILLDGHNRLEICRRHNLPFEIEEIGIASRDDALVWIERNQLGRRNLSTDQRAAIAVRLQRRLSKVAVEMRQKTAGEARAAAAPRTDDGKMTSSLSVNVSDRLAESAPPAIPTTASPPPVAHQPSAPAPIPAPEPAKVEPPKAEKPKRDTRAEAAKKLGISERSVRSASEIAKVDPDAIDRLARGETTLAKERAKLKKHRRAERESDLAAATIAASQQLGTKLYNVLYADPPWRFEPYSRDTGMDRAADNRYPTMTLDDIKALKVPAADNCVLFLWATTPMLPQALEVMAAWGFDYKSHFVWLKDKMGTGFWVRDEHELLLIGTKGKVPAPAPGEQHPSTVEGPRLAHSAKPPVFREIIERMFSTVPRLEMFARSGAEGWDFWGNEVDQAVPAMLDEAAQ